MYDLQTDAALACFDPNNLPLSSTISNNINDINNINIINNDNNNNNNNNNNNIHNNNFQPVIHSNSMALDFQNPIDNSNNNNNDDDNNNNNNYNDNDNNNNWSSTNINQQFDETIYQTTTTSDLLTLLHLPRCSTTLLAQPQSSHTPPISFLGEINPNINMNMNMNMNGIQDSGLPGSSSSSYDPLFHLNLPPQPSPLLRGLMFHGYPTSSSVSNAATSGVPASSLFAHQIDDVMNGISGMYQESGGGCGGGGDGAEHMMNQNAMFEFTTLDDGKAKSPKNFVTERQRRINFNSKYQQLRSLIPTPTKIDRASIVLDAISYINELKRTVGELKLLVEKRRISKDRNKRLKTEENNPSENGGSENNINNNSNSHGADGAPVAGLVKPDPDDAFVGQLRSSWLQRKCKDTEVDVRIVDDEVTIKLVQRKKVNCLLSVSRTLDDLQLDLRHVAGGHVGDYYSYLFNSKISEGSSVYASAIANKLIEVVERQYAAASVAVAPTSSF